MLSLVFLLKLTSSYVCPTIVIVKIFEDFFWDVITNTYVDIHYLQFCVYPLHCRVGPITYEDRSLPYLTLFHVSPEVRLTS